LVAALAATLLDNFNRADGPIGPGWTVHSGTCSVVSNAATCSSWGLATFNAYSGSGDSAETATILRTTPGGTVIANQAQINYDGSGGGSNTATRPTDDPAQGGAQDPTSFTVLQPEPIPTFGQIGLATLVFLVKVAGAAVLRRVA